MIKRIKKSAVYIGIILIIIIAGLVSFDVKTEFEQDIDYSSYSTKGNGSKVLYLLAGKMGFDVRRYTRQSRFLPDKSTIVVFAPDTEKFNDPVEQKYLKEWLSDGNSMILIDNMYNYEENFDLKEFSGSSRKQFGEFGENYIFNIGKGKIIFLEEYEFYTNEGIRILDPGVLFIDALYASSHKKVLFNEFYHGVGNESASLWDLLNSGGRIALIQILVALLVYLYVISRRFGKPLVVFETIKRKENENLFALSNLYTKAGAYNLALSIYMENLTRELAKFLGFGTGNADKNELMAAAAANRVLKDMAVGEVIRESEILIETRSRDSKKFIGLFARLEDIRKEIKS